MGKRLSELGLAPFFPEDKSTRTWPALSVVCLFSCLLGGHLLCDSWLGAGPRTCDQDQGLTAARGAPYHCICRPQEVLATFLQRRGGCEAPSGRWSVQGGAEGESCVSCVAYCTAIFNVQELTKRLEPFEWGLAWERYQLAAAITGQLTLEQAQRHKYVVSEVWVVSRTWRVSFAFRCNLLQIAASTAGSEGFRPILGALCDECARCVGRYWFLSFAHKGGSLCFSVQEVVGRAVLEARGGFQPR